jgi:PDZ domain
MLLAPLLAPLLAAFACACLGLSHAGLRAQSPAAQTQEASGAPRFNFAGNAAEIPADFTGNVVFLPVGVNRSRPSYFLLDSTAPVSSIDPHRAAELGLAPSQPSMLNLHGVDIPFAALAQQASPNFGAQMGRVYEGTLGADFLERVVVEIDYGRLTVRLYDPATYQYSGLGKSLPLTFAGVLPLVQGKVSDPGGKSRGAAYVVNTALDASVVISNRYAEAQHVRSHWKMVSAWDAELDNPMDALLGRSKGFQLGPYFAQDTLVTFSKSEPPGASDPRIAGEIGGGLLRRFRVVLDYPHRQMFLDTNSRFTNEEEEDKSGIGLIAKGPALKTFEIVEVGAHTPAAAAGLQKGDMIAGIDEDAAADLTLAQIRDLFRQIGHKYKLLIERNGQNKQIQIEMRRYL